MSVEKKTPPFIYLSSCANGHFLFDIEVRGPSYSCVSRPSWSGLSDHWFPSTQSFSLGIKDCVEWLAISSLAHKGIYITKNTTYFFAVLHHFQLLDKCHYLGIKGNFRGKNDFINAFNGTIYLVNSFWKSLRNGKSFEFPLCSGRIHGLSR